MHDIYEVNKWSQLSKFSDEARKAWMTQIFSYPMNMIDKFVDSLTVKLLDF